MSEITTIEETFKNISVQLNNMNKTTKLLQDELKNINKIVKTCSKSNKSRHRKPPEKKSLSNELELFLSVNQGTKLTKAEVMKEVSNYIKDKNLQVEEDKRRFLPNKELSKMFGLKKPYNMTFVEINKYVSHHLSK